LAKQVTFLHGADLHLGRLLKTVGYMSPMLQKKINDAVYTAFRRMINAALRHKVDFVVLSGDIYDQTERSAGAKRFFIAEVERLIEAAIPVYIIYGNHDPLEEQIEFFKYPNNVHVLSADQVDILEVTGRDETMKARIIGQSYSQPSEKRKMHNLYRPPDHDVVNIALLHTGLNPGYRNYVPCSADELKSISDIDYWALGHIHKRQIINYQYPVIAFPGIPQGRDMGELGLGGCLLVTAKLGNEAKLQFVPTSSIVWLAPEIPVKGDENSEDDLIDLMKETGEQILDGAYTAPEAAGLELAPNEKIEVDGYIVRWYFTGSGEIHNIVEKDDEIVPELVERIRQEFSSNRPFLWTDDIRFETSSPLVDLENISEEDVILNTLLHIYKEFKDDSEVRKQVIERIGKSWYEQKDPEDIRDKAFALDDENYRSLIEKALHMAAQRIMERREA
jgi:DNA repair protein SbcD/Mre11